jgi:anti-anti-sigma factor
MGVSAAAEPFVTEALRWLPAPQEADGTPTGLPVVPGHDPLATSPGRVLVADDNADMREYLQRLLSPRYDVQVVADGQAALDAALAAPPDLVLSDVMMPHLDGMALLTALRADERTARVPVVLLSARAGQEAAVEGLTAGADDYLVKPFSARELMARVGAHVELGRVRRESEERLRAMADLAPALIWVADAAGQRVFLNAGWREFTGHSLSDDLGDRWQSALHPEDRARYLDVVAAAAAAHRPWEVEYRLRRADGAFHWLLERAVPLGSDDGTAGYVGSCTDINARYQESQRQRLLAAVGETIDRETEIPRQLNALARLTVDSRLADLCTVRVVGDDGLLRVVGAAGPDAASEAELARLTPETGVGPSVAATGEVILVDAGDGARTGDGLPGDDVIVGRLGVRSRLAVPLRVRDRVLAVLGLGRRSDAPPYNDDDRVLLEEIASRAALALDNTMLLAEERASAQRLALLQRATAELSAATTPMLVASSAAAHLRQLLGEGTGIGVFELDEQKRTLVALTQTEDDETVRARWSSVPLSVDRPVTAAVEQRRAQWLDATTDPDAPAGGAALPLVAGGRPVGVIGIALAAGRRIDRVERATLLALAEQCALALDRARLYRAERQIAETLQRSLLPQRLPRLERLALAARYVPGAEGTQAGGDWYDVIGLDGSSQVAIAVGDVVGQGPAAAAVMGQLRSALSTALLSGSSPAQALELLDRFAARLPGANASTAACVVIDWDEGLIRWARAGHPPPLLLSDGRAQFLEDAGSGTVLGVSWRKPYAEGTARIQPGAVLVLYTDGLVERRDEVLDQGLDRLAEAVRRHGSTTPDRLATGLLEEMLADTGQPDDVALIAVRLLPAPLEGRIPAEPRQLAGVRRAVEAWAHQAGLGHDTLEDLQLALGEALANGVEHAYTGQAPGECAFRVSWRPEAGVDVLVTDFGTWRPPPADPGFRGRGLTLMGILGDDLRVERSPGGGTTVHIHLPWREEDRADAGPLPTGPGPRVRPAEDRSARITRRSDDGAVVLGITGELDLDAATSLGPDLLDCVADGAGVVIVDLHGTTYLASAGVGLLLQAAARARSAGTELRVVVPPAGSAARLLRLSGLEGVLTVGADDQRGA